MRSSAALLALTLTVVPQLAHATTSKVHTHDNITGNSVYATWESDQGPIHTYVSLSATDQSDSPTTTADRLSYVSIYVSQYNVDTGGVIMSGYADMNNVPL